MPANEDLIRVTAFIYRKPGISEAEFHHYWAEIHGPKMLELSVKYGVVEYRQYHTTPQAKAMLDAATKATGKECHACDGTAEMFVKDIKAYLSMTADREFVEAIVPDQLRFMDLDRLEFTVGYEYGVIAGSERVTEHTRRY
ncbi:hypothetical protein A1O3_02490 [Capronia epimyces CBS 606.96]|uniref:EthD domain-containing protein n=1 Tax=Capronia epimyces CBS 606.96 TaxID=1182542 RepID=W9YAA3_9EURO|nr:uncharacterized protein A1O3_02490 [Capronia epimyces CBS 606.96]EXJ89423.1 hypothetical protein A1O3_02490 [Capronia epimyces CBS 606.96]